MDIKIFLIIAFTLSMSNSLPRIIPSTFRYIFLRVIFLHGMELHIKNDTIKFVECYRKIHDDYLEALTNFTNSMKNLSGQIYKKYPEFKTDEKKASYGSILILMDIGNKTLQIEDKIWKSIQLGDYDKIKFVYHYIGFMKYEVGEMYDKFLKKIKLMQSRRFEREEAVKNDIARYRDVVLHKLRAVAHYFKLCMTDAPFKEITGEIKDEERDIIM